MQIIMVYLVQLASLIGGKTMKLVSYNIQAGIGADSYFSYVLRAHRQVLPSRTKSHILAQIATYLSHFDIACVQEVDLGGLRNGFHNQVQQLLSQTPFNYYAYQVNRQVSKVSLHGNVILSRYPLRIVVNTPLPSKIKGRGLLAVQAQTETFCGVIANVHLS